MNILCEIWNHYLHGKSGTTIYMGNMEPLFTWKIWNHYLHGKSGTTVYMGNPEPLFTWEIWNHCLHGKSGTTIYMGNLEPLFISEQKLARLCLVTRSNFSVLVNCKKKVWRHLVASQKSLFRWEIPKIITFPGQSFEQGQLDHQQFGIEMPDTCGEVIEGSTFLIDFLAQKRMSQEVKEGSKMLFLYFFDPFGPS